MVSEQACQGALTQKQTLRSRFESPSSLLERLQGRIALEALYESRSNFWAKSVPVEPAGTKRVCFSVSGAGTKANAWRSVRVPKQPT